MNVLPAECRCFPWSWLEGRNLLQSVWSLIPTNTVSEYLNDDDIHTQRRVGYGAGRRRLKVEVKFSVEAFCFLKLSGQLQPPPPTHTPHTLQILACVCSCFHGEGKLTPSALTPLTPPSPPTYTHMNTPPPSPCLDLDLCVSVCECKWEHCFLRTQSHPRLFHRAAGRCVSAVSGLWHNTIFLFTQQF